MADDFECVKEYLIDAVSPLSDSRDFDIISCSGGEPLAQEMSTKKLVPATIVNIEQAGKFIAEAKIANGKMDYAAAFKKACQVLDAAENRKSARPLIIFLASGDFKDDDKVLDVIKKYKELNPIINAYEYGLVVKTAQESLTKIAHDTDGRYKLVPRNVSLATVRLPVDAKSDVISLVVSPKKNQIFLVASKGEGANATISSMAIDVATDEKTDLKKLIPGLPADWTVWPGPVCDDDGAALLCARPLQPPLHGDSVYLQSGVKIADDCRLIGWLGKKVVYQAWGDGLDKPIHIYDPGEKKAQELRSADSVIAADPRGKFILTLHAQRTATTTFVLDEGGKKIQELDVAPTSGTQSQISHNGKYFAAQVLPAGAKDAQVRVMALYGRDWTLHRSVSPVAVLNDGRLLVLEDTSDHHVKLMSLYDSQGRQTELGKVQTAVVARDYADKIYFVTVEERPAVKCMEIPAVKP
jgi:hypothetical protein